MKKAFRKSLAFLLSLTLLFCAVPFSWVEASAAEPIPLDAEVTPSSGGSYTIANAEQLKRLSDIVKGGNECTGATFTLTEDIVLNPGELTVDTNGDPLYNGSAVGVGNQPEKWFPIGYKYDLDGNGTDENVIFKGVFDGNGHTVSGLFFNNTKQDCVGLFGQTNDDAKIKNVGVIKSYIRGRKNVGGVCGDNGGELSNCYNTGIMIGTYNNVGGVCGFNVGKLSNCYNTGTVSGTDSFVGGVCGYNNYTIINCYNIGSVSGTNTVVGGVCGFNSGELSNCYNTDSVSGAGYIGGVCGTNKYVIMNCYNTGTVSGNIKIGGVCGHNISDDTIINCYYLDTACGNAGGGESKTEQEMKDAAFVSSLGSHYISSFFELNGGYPLLKSLCEFTGDGTATAPYIIYTANQLNYMSYLVNFDN